MTHELNERLPRGRYARNGRRDRPVTSPARQTGAVRSSRPARGPRLTRRGVLRRGGRRRGRRGAAGAVGVQQGLLPGGAWLERRLGDPVDGPVPDVAAGRVVSGSFVSRARLGVRCGWAVAYPPGRHRDLPVAVVLHGKHGDHAKVFDRGYLALDTFLADDVAASGTPFALASVDGGNSYWHARDSGEDAGAMVRDELLPLLGRHGLRTDRVGLMGWSMGGFGALSLAGRWGPRPGRGRGRGEPGAVPVVRRGHAGSPTTTRPTTPT